MQEYWIRLLYGYGSRANGYSQSHRPILSKHFQILKWFCDLSKQFVALSILSFKTSSLISATILPRSLFLSELNNNLDQSIQQKTEQFRRELNQMLGNVENVYVTGGFNTDWLPEYGNESNNFIISNVPRLFPKDDCNCAITHECFEPLLVGPPNLILPGLVVGCTPMRGLQMSTLECFYSVDCISTIVNHFTYYTELDGTIHHEAVNETKYAQSFHPLKNDSISDDIRAILVSAIIDRFFVDEWKTNGSYEHYFNYCASSTCTYNYPASHDAIDIFTALISFYGSLAIFWRVFAWRAVLIYKTIRPS